VSDWEAERSTAPRRTRTRVERTALGERGVERRPVSHGTDRVLDPRAHRVEQGPDASPHKVTQRPRETQQPSGLARVSDFGNTGGHCFEELRVPFVERLELHQIAGRLEQFPCPAVPS
jgi:hypothetical protein